MNAPTRVTPRGASGSQGYGFELLTFEPAQVQQLSALRTDGSTVNDVLLGGLALAVSRWNHQHGASSGAIYLMMPINLRPPEWRLDVVGSFASYVSVRVGSSDRTTLEDAIAAAADSTRRIKDGAIAGLIVDPFGAPPILPTAVKRRMQDLIALTGNVVVDTAVFSNRNCSGDSVALPSVVCGEQACGGGVCVEVDVE